jgi:hypothetical protein
MEFYRMAAHIWDPSSPLRKNRAHQKSDVHTRKTVSITVHLPTHAVLLELLWQSMHVSISQLQETGQDETNLVTGCRVTLTEKD